MELLARVNGEVCNAILAREEKRMPACHVQSNRVVNIPAILTFQRLQILSELSYMYCAFEGVSGDGVWRPFMSRFIRIVPRRAGAAFNLVKRPLSNTTPLTPCSITQNSITCRTALRVLNHVFHTKRWFLSDREV